MSTHHKPQRLSAFHIIALSATLILIVLISCDTISAAGHSSTNLRMQLGICMILLADLAVVLVMRQHVDRIKGVFMVYIILLVAVVYFSSLIFYAEERAVNPDVHSYGDAIWWAIMCMTTAGSYITEYTLYGKIMSVVLSGGGLILFPVFTVYITSAVTHTRAKV